jgi:hypothetical protein
MFTVCENAGTVKIIKKNTLRKHFQTAASGLGISDCIG